MLRLTSLCFLILLSGCSGGHLTREAPTAPVQDEFGAYEFRSEALARHVRAFYQEGFHAQPRGNVTIIEQSDGLVVVDTGGSPTAASEVIGHIRENYRKSVKAVVFTHWHGDHVLGATAFVEAWPQVRIIASTETARMLADPASDQFMPGEDAAANQRLQVNIQAGVDYFADRSDDAELTPREQAGFAHASQELRRYGEELQTARRIPPTETFTTSLEIPDATAPIEIHLFGRGNTEGDAVVWLPRQRIVMTGDLLVAPVPFGFNSYPQDWIATLQDIAALEPAIIVPGHGRPMRDQVYLQNIVAALQLARAEAARVADNAAVTSENALQHFQFGTIENDFVGEDAWLRRWLRAYWSGPIASSALREARGQPIVQGTP